MMRPSSMIAMLRQKALRLVQVVGGQDYGHAKLALSSVIRSHMDRLISISTPAVGSSRISSRGW